MNFRFRLKDDPSVQIIPIPQIEIDQTIQQLLQAETEEACAEVAIQYIDLVHKQIEGMKYLATQHIAARFPKEKPLPESELAELNQLLEKVLNLLTGSNKPA